MVSEEFTSSDRGPQETEAWSGFEVGKTECSAQAVLALRTTQPAIFSPDSWGYNFVFWTDVANLKSCKALALSNPFFGLEDRVRILQYE